MLDILTYKAWALEKSFLDRVAPLVIARLNAGQSLEPLINKQPKIDEQLAAEMGVRMGMKVNYDRESGLLTTTSDAKHTVAILPIVGSLTKRGDLCSYGMRDYEAMIQRMNDAENIAGMVLELDSPGGTADGTPELAKVIADSEKPIVTFGDTTVASAAMWIASQTSYIIANANNPTEFGSIGTLYIHQNWSAYIAKEIGSVEVIRAPQSVNKALINPFEEMPEEARAELIEELRQLTNDFVSSVGKGRGLKVTTGKAGKRILVSPGMDQDGDPENITDGRMYKAQKAIDLGLIDAIGTFKDAINKVSELAAGAAGSPPSEGGKSQAVALGQGGDSDKPKTSNQNTNMKILQFLGFSQKTNETLSADEQNALASAEEKLIKLESENALLKEQAQANTELIGELKSDNKKKDQEIADLTAKLDADPIEEQPDTTQEEDAQQGDPNQEAIDNLPHNKELDSNPMFQGKETEVKTQKPKQ